jgi:sugar transferase (PEP-CTERM system associated)
LIRVFQHYISARKLALVLSETALLFLIFALGSSMRIAPFEIRTEEIYDARFTALLAAIVCQITLGFQDLYEWRISAQRRERYPRIVAACGISFVVLAAIFFYFQVATESLGFGVAAEDIRIRTWRFIATVVCAFIGIAVFRAFFHGIVGKWGLEERILILGSGELALSLAREISDHRDCGFEIAGMLPGPNEAPKHLRRRDPNVPLLERPTSELYDIARELRVQRVIVALQDRRQALPIEQLLRCRLSGIRIEERELLYERVTGRIAVEALRPSYLIFSEGFSKSHLTLLLKRLLDVLASLVGLALTLPITLATAIAIRLDSPGTIFYKQERIGRDGKPFMLVKFRSMRADAEKHTGPVWATANDDRVTLVGRFIRRVRVDEIPQMWNVLRGEMSFVGPRPERKYFTDELAKEIPYFLERLSVKPGLTGWAQVCYPYGNTKADAIQKLQYDLFYVKNMSLLFDVTVILRTVKVVLLQRGAV